MDTAATALWLLGIPVPPGLDGRPVVAAFEAAGAAPATGGRRSTTPEGAPPAER
jgi:hypothetical protein